MKKASIISIGNEILTGQTVDTNAAYMSERLLSIGMPVVSSYTVGDEVDRIVRALKLASDDGDVILVTGGLGPTDDDITRQAIAEFMGVELEFNEGLLQRIESYFSRRKRRASEKTKVQAYIPAGSEILVNDLGTAAGIAAKVGEKRVFVMPGVPSEMKQMFEISVLPELKGFANEQAVIVRKLKCFGAGESSVAELLGDLMRRGRNPLINCTVECGVMTLHIIASDKDKDVAEGMAEKDEKLLRDKLGELIYGTGEQSLAEVVGKKLSKAGMTVATAESCTGGLLAKFLTDVSGASEYFTHGWVTYSNQAKIQELGVPAELIEEYGAVSEQVSGAMARCAREKGDTDFAIGITGIAGPTGGTEQKPVGLVYVSIDSEIGCETKHFVFSHDRGFVRLLAARTALNMLRLKMQV